MKLLIKSVATAVVLMFVTYPAFSSADASFMGSAPSSVFSVGQCWGPGC